jgi:hypothetical protein
MNVNYVKRLRLDWEWIMDHKPTTTKWNRVREEQVLESDYWEGTAYVCRKPFCSVYILKCLNEENKWEVSVYKNGTQGYYWNIRDYLAAFRFFVLLLKKGQDLVG